MPNSQNDRSRLVLPLFLIAAILLTAVPLLHPVGTCTHWLEKWGEASAKWFWVPIHELAMIGFGFAAAAGIFYPLVSRPTMSSIVGGGAMGTGFIIASLSNLIHATAASSLGHAYMSTTLAAEKKMIYTVAEAFVSYDVGATSTSSLMISFGCCLLVVSLFRRRALSLFPALVMVGLGLVWTFQYHGIFNRLGFSLPETLHWASLSLWLAAFGFISSFSGGAATPAEEREGIAPQTTALSTSD